MDYFIQFLESKRNDSAGILSLFLSSFNILSHYSRLNEKLINSTTDFFTWSRDSSLTMKLLIDNFIAGDKFLQPLIEDYIFAQAKLQKVKNPSGGLADGLGLGEPKFEANGTAFTGAWGRPQRDGPALRALALITYSKWLLANNERSKALHKVWPIIKNDLSYIGQY